MKQLVAIVVFVSLFVQGMSRLTVIALYQLNKDYIARNLCENRMQPEKKCCGKCYLRKQLRNASDRENGTHSRTIKVEKNEVVYVLPAPMQWQRLSTVHLLLVHAPCGEQFTHQLVLRTVFHPPGQHMLAFMA